MKVLLICNKWPYPAREGGSIAMDATIRGLVDEGIDVTILAANSHKFPIEKGSFPEDLNHRVHYHSASVNLRIHPITAFVCLLRGKSYHATRFYSKAFSALLHQTLKTQQYDIIQLESVFMGVYLEEIRALSQCPIVLRAHNVEHQIWERIAKHETLAIKRWYLRQLAAALKRFETEVVKSCDAIAGISPQDAAWFSSITMKPVDFIPFSVKTSQGNVLENPSSIASVFHLGSMNWWPNEEGIQWFLKEVWPRVRSKDPALCFHMAGRAMPKYLQSQPEKGIFVYGEIEDAKKFMAMHPIMVIPLLSGSGMRVKMVEGMLAGSAIVSTTIGAEGIPLQNGTHAILADNPLAFAEAVIKLAQNPSIRHSMGKAAHAFALETFDREKQSRKLLALFQKLRQEHT